MSRNSEISRIITPIDKELGYLSERLQSQFHNALKQVKTRLSVEELAAWAKEGLALASNSPPLSLETATAYFRVSPEILNSLIFPHFLDWVHGGKTLYKDCPSLATSYFLVSPEVLTMIPHKFVEVWLDMGRSFYRNTPESLALASSYFASTSKLLEYLSLPRIELLALFINRLAKTSPELAAECLNSATQVFARIEKEEQEQFLALALILIRTNPEGAASYFNQGAEVLSKINTKQRKIFLALTTKIARFSVRRALSFFFDCSRSLYQIDSTLHSQLLRRSETLLAISDTAGIEFLKSCPALLARLKITGLERWFEEGVRILKQDQKSGLAYFRLNSMNEARLKRLRVRVDLKQISRIVLIYSQALAGTRVQIRSAEGTGEGNKGWIHPDKPTTDGTNIYLPRSMDRYDSENENFIWYKVAVTHQAGHIEFGTFNFSFEKEAGLFSNRRHQLSATDGTGLTDMARFFNLFNNRKLSSDIFTVIEDMRVDYLLKKEYAGIRGDYQWIQEDSLSRRPFILSLPLREALLEIIIRISLDKEYRFIPLILSDQLETAMQILKRIQSPEATVEDSAEATIRLYDILKTIPNIRSPDWEKDMVDLGEKELTDADFSDARRNWEDRGNKPEIEMPYQAPADVEFRGSLNPEMVQLLPKLREDPDHPELHPLPLSPKEVQISGVLQGKHSSSGLFITELPATTGAQEIPPEKQDGGKSQPKATELVEETLENEGGESFLYDEWDFEACCYLPGWCRVREKALNEGRLNFFRETLSRHSVLASQIKKQFEMLTPELLERLNKRHDGEELDLNAVIEAVVDRKAGHSADEKIYWKRRKTKRDVAAIFLLDMSSSTANAIRDRNEEKDYPDLYFGRFKALPQIETHSVEDCSEGSQRVIDVMKESVVLMVNALRITGDSYGIYGFSGHGRENVDLLVIKGIDEQFSQTIERRIDSIRPFHSTRMGPAIRHAISKLETCDSKTKILFLISDGYPQDKDYGRDGNDKEYALHDTKMALIEAKRKDITPFCLTIDMGGYDYLKDMSQDIGYEVVNNVESLPRHLPMLYKKLTS